MVRARVRVRVGDAVVRNAVGRKVVNRAVVVMVRRVLMHQAGNVRRAPPRLLVLKAKH